LGMVCSSFLGGSDMPLTRKMRATAPYRMLYSDLMVPPCAATPLAVFHTVSVVLV
jgi:hypothetical protein